MEIKWFSEEIKERGKERGKWRQHIKKILKMQVGTNGQNNKRKLDHKKSSGYSKR